MTRLTGIVHSRATHGPIEGWDVVRLRVARAQAVPELADLVSPQVGETGEVEVAVRRELLGAAGPGWHLDLRARLTPNGLLAEKQPADGQFTATPPADAV